VASDTSPASHVAPADQPRIRDGVVGARNGRVVNQRRAVAGEAGDAVDTRGPQWPQRGHRRQHVVTCQAGIDVSEQWHLKDRIKHNAHI